MILKVKTEIAPKIVHLHRASLYLHQTAMQFTFSFDNTLYTKLFTSRVYLPWFFSLLFSASPLFFLYTNVPILEVHMSKKKSLVSSYPSSGCFTNLSIFLLELSLSCRPRPTTAAKYVRFFFTFKYLKSTL